MIVVRRGWLWLRSEAPFVTVVALILAATAYLYLAPGHWRRASALIAVALLAAGLFRMVLPSTHAGLLVVRGRARDTATYLLVGGVVLAAAIHLH